MKRHYSITFYKPLYSTNLSAPHPGISSSMITLLSLYSFIISFSVLLDFTSSDQGIKKVHLGCSFSIFTDGSLEHSPMAMGLSPTIGSRSEEHTSELQSRENL